MKTLTRPVTLRGFGDDGGDFSNLPLTSTGAVDWSQLSLPAAPSYAPTPVDAPLNLSNLLQQVVTGGTTFFKDQTALTTAQQQAALAKAQGDAALAITKAAGARAAGQAGGQGALPSPSLLLIAGLGLAAIFLLKR